MAERFHLISSVTCPWVQRSVIVMRAKGAKFDVTYVDLQNRPQWFVDMSPHGQVPLLKVDGVVLFESNAIVEYLDETLEPRLHPADPIKRARNRAWTDYLPTFAWGPGLSNLSYCTSREELAAAMEDAREVVGSLENAIRTQRGNDGPYFNGDKLCLVDASYGPFFQRFAIVEKALRTGLLDAFPLVKAWSDALLANDLIVGSVPPNFAEEFDKNLERRGALAWRIMQGAAAAE